MEKIKSMFSQLMKDNENMKHIKYSNFNSLQEVGDDSKESRYDFLLAKVSWIVFIYFLWPIRNASFPVTGCQSGYWIYKGKYGLPNC